MPDSIRILVITALLGGAAFAQEPDRAGLYAGAGVQGGYVFDVCLLFGTCGGVNFATNIRYLQLAADAIYEPRLSGAPLDPYVGSGIRFALVQRGSPPSAAPAMVAVSGGLIGGALPAT